MLFKRKPSQNNQPVAENSGVRNQALPGKPRNRRRKIALICTLLFFCVVGVGGILLVKLMMGPAEGTVINSFPEARSTEPVVQLEQFEAKFLTFAYPNTYELQPQNKDNVNNLETHTFIASGMMNKILTVTITSLPSGKLEDDASYYMRSLRPEIYQLKPLTIGNERVIIAVNAKDSQQAAFWAHKSPNGNKLLTFTMSSVSINSKETATEYQKMLESISWR